MTASARGFGWGKKGSFSRARAPADVYEKNEKKNKTMSVCR